MLSVKEKFKNNPLLYYALSICATWAGIGSMLNGVAVTQTFGIVPSLIMMSANIVACMIFGHLVFMIPKVREVFGSKIVLRFCGIVCVFQAWLSMTGIHTVFSDTVLGQDSGMYIAYAIAIFFLAILYHYGMIRNVLTDGFGWIIVYALAAIVTAVSLYQCAGSYNTISLGLEAEPLKAGIWKAILLLPGPFMYPYFFELINYNEKNDDGTAPVDVKKAFTLGGVFFGIYMVIIFGLAWTRFTPALAMIKAILITLIGTSTLSSSMYSIYIAFGKKFGLLLNAGLIIGWHILVPLGVMGGWTLMASVRIFFVMGAILFAYAWYFWEKLHPEVRP